jgi:hypothetical protein
LTGVFLLTLFVALLLSAVTVIDMSSCPCCDTGTGTAVCCCDGMPASVFVTATVTGTGTGAASSAELVEASCVWSNPTVVFDGDCFDQIDFSCVTVGGVEYWQLATGLAGTKTLPKDCATDRPLDLDFGSFTWPVSPLSCGKTLNLVVTE